MMAIKGNYLKNSAKNIWNVAKYHDKGVCRCYASRYLFWLWKICKLLKNTTNYSGQGQEVMPWWSSHVLACYSVLKYITWERGKEANHFFIF